MPYDITIGDKKYSGEEIDFEPLEEQWNKYKLSDGTIVRAKLEVFKILKVVDEEGIQIISDKSNEPVYAIQHRVDVVLSNLK